MPPELEPTGGPAPDMWQSLDQWMDTPQFERMMRDEFPEDAAEWLDPVSRRKFLTLMGASVALAGAAGCNPSVKPASQRKSIPYVKQPADVIPGVPLFFATAIPQIGGVGLGLIVKSVEGRPIKIEGNPKHSGSLGGTDVWAQASVLGMYDPDRSKDVRHNGNPGSLDKGYAAIRDALDKQRPSQGDGVRIVTEPCTSPTLTGLIDEFLKRYPKAKWIQYDTAARDNARRGALAAFGKYVNTVYHFDKARVVLSLDSDFLSATGPGAVRYAREFIAGRKFRDLDVGLKGGDGVRAADLNRLYAVESMLTCTGAKADHRLPVKPSEVEAFARALAAELGVAGVTGAAPNGAKGWVKPVADDLRANPGAAVVIVGDTQPPVVHLLAHAINEKLRAFGSTVTFTDPVEARPADTAAEFKQLVDDMNAGKVGLLLLMGGNPVYDAPADLDFPKALAAVRAKGLVVHHGLYGQATDETAAQCTWHVNAAHYLESWGDVRGYDGTVTVQQPLIAPLHGGKTPIELFALLLGMEVSDPLELVKGTWRRFFDERVKSGDFTRWWESAVRDGVVPGTNFQPATVAAVKLDALAEKAFAPPAVKPGLELQYRPDPMLYDGRFANNGWLQEIPKPLTGLTWDNAAIMSPKTAAGLGLFEKHWFTGDHGNGFNWTGGERGRQTAIVATLELDGRTLQAAVYILPSHADDCVTLHLGHGRERAGRVGTGAGFNAYKLRTSTSPWNAAGLNVTKGTETYYLAATQGQYAMESRRPVRVATVEQFNKDHDFAQVPAVSAGEYKDIRALTPGTQEEWERLHGKAGRPYPHPHHHDGHANGNHNHGHEERGEHDERMIPLNLYPDNPQKVSGGQEASKSYRRWAMAIDLNACTGCTACVAACVSENNTPVVGKDQVTRGRAMHWIRIDRYFSIPGAKPHDDDLGSRDVRGDRRAEAVQRAADIRTDFQPTPCQQCEKAPCEVVCPVGATVHSADGLNDMVYNRCVGTRYCANNCPYKVRRFNFFQFADYSTDSLKLVNNPDVTVRQRGVMEKCTYCVQRIRAAEVEAEREFQTRPKDANGRPKIRDGEVVTACQAACPTGAIVFGDLNDADSVVLRWKAEPTNYGLLAELNTMPRTSYLAAVRNPNPALEKTSKGGA